jgi:hypothetical protein
MNKCGRGEEEGGAAPSYSPPCLLNDVDPAYQGYLCRDDLLALLNALLEAERAGAKVARTMTANAGGGPAEDTLKALAMDEAHFCAMLAGHIKRLEAVPSQRTGAFREKVLALQGMDDRLRLLNRGQGWVVRKLKDAIPRIGDEALHSDLVNMLLVHETNYSQVR